LSYKERTHYISLNDKLYKVLKRKDAILSIKECDILKELWYSFQKRFNRIKCERFTEIKRLKGKIQIRIRQRDRMIVALIKR